MKKNQGKKVFKAIGIIGLIIAIIGVILFVGGACGGTITGYKGADGKYYSDLGAKGSLDFLCVPGIIMAIIGGIVFFVWKNNKDE